MFKATKGNQYKPVMRYVVHACWEAGVARRTMHAWFLGSKEGTRRSRLRGWMHWVAYCDTIGMQPAQLITHPKPEQLYADFLVWLTDGKPKAPVLKDAPPAV
jgi:hypothetical protein